MTHISAAPLAGAPCAAPRRARHEQLHARPPFAAHAAAGAARRCTPPLHAALCAAARRRCGGVNACRPLAALAAVPNADSPSAAVESAADPPEVVAALPAASVNFIGSVNNAYVKHAVKLRTSRSYRDAAGTLLLCGGRILEEVAGVADAPGASDEVAPEAALRARVLLLAEGAPLPRGVHAERTLYASPDVLRKIAGVESGDSLDAVAELYAPRLFTPTPEQASAAVRVLLLDGVQDPGNLGTLLRSAAAFGVAAACLAPGCCDPFNAKAVRASRGACLRLPLWRATWSQLAALADVTGAVVLGADPRGEGSGATLAAAAAAAATPGAKPLWLALGAEGPGLSLQAQAICTPVAIPRAGGMESLNVAVAGSILMYILAPPTSRDAN